MDRFQDIHRSRQALLLNHLMEKDRELEMVTCLQQPPLHLQLKSMCTNLLVHTITPLIFQQHHPIHLDHLVHDRRHIPHLHQELRVLVQKAMIPFKLILSRTTVVILLQSLLFPLMQLWTCMSSTTKHHSMNMQNLPLTQTPLHRPQIAMDRRREGVLVVDDELPL